MPQATLSQAPCQRLHTSFQESAMGLLDSIVGQVSGALAGSVPGGQVHPGLMDVVSSLMTQGGGLPGLMQSVVGEPHIAAVAAKLGLQPQDIANQLAGLLPHAVDSVTPAGAVPQGNLL